MTTRTYSDVVARIAKVRLTRAAVQGWLAATNKNDPQRAEALRQLSSIEAELAELYKQQAGDQPSTEQS